MAKLVLMLNDVAINEYKLEKENITLGRSASNDILVDDPIVSTQHAIIRTKKNAFMPEVLDVFYEDLNSTNGSRINKMKLTKPQQLKQGDIIQIGRSVFRYEDEISDQIDATAIYLPEDEEH
jgi:pSer/pThr/pTyr-binding forkhead associated (FHA) protein